MVKEKTLYIRGHEFKFYLTIFQDQTLNLSDSIIMESVTWNIFYFSSKGNVCLPISATKQAVKFRVFILCLLLIVGLAAAATNWINWSLIHVYLHQQLTAKSILHAAEINLGKVLTNFGLPFQ